MAIHGHLVQVLGFNTRNEADEFIQDRNVFVMGAVHFHESDTGRLQYIVQSNTTVSCGCCNWTGHQQGCVCSLAGAQDAAGLAVDHQQQAALSR